MDFPSPELGENTSLLLMPLSSWCFVIQSWQTNTPLLSANAQLLRFLTRLWGDPFVGLRARREWGRKMATLASHHAAFENFLGGSTKAGAAPVDSLCLRESRDL